MPPAAAAPMEGGPEYPPVLSLRLRRHGLEDFPDGDPTVEVESPRSVAACAVEGIRPKDLTYVPPEAFKKPDIAPEVAALRYEYFEAYRQDLLALARCALSAAAAGRAPPHPLAPPVDPRSEGERTLNFFLEKLRELNIKIIPVREDWSTGTRNPEFKPVDFYAPYRSTSSEGSVGPSGRPLFLSATGSSMEDPGLESSGGSWWANTDLWRSPVSPEALQDVLEKVKTAPGTDWRELEAARRVEDTFGPSRLLDLKARSERHANQNVLIQKRVKALTSSFTKLELEQQRKDRLREIREYMSPPVDCGNSAEAQARVRANLVKFTKGHEEFRREHAGRRAEKEQALERQLVEDRNMTRMRYAQKNAEDRVRWRHNYAAMTDMLAEERAGVIEDFRRKQAQLDAAGRRAEETGHLRKEVMNLRHTHRMLEEHRRRRKFEHEELLRSLQIMTLAERRVEESRRRAALSASRSLPQLPSAAVSPTGSSALLARQAALLDLLEGQTEQLSREETEWAQRVVSPQASALSRQGGGAAPDARHRARAMAAC